MCGVPYKRLVEGRIASQRHGQRKVPGLMPDQRLKLTGPAPRSTPPQLLRVRHSSPSLRGHSAGAFPASERICLLERWCLFSGRFRPTAATRQPLGFPE